MIPKEWRDYTWKVRPLVVLTWLICSPAFVLPLLWVWSHDGIDWPAWVQAVGSVVAIFAAWIIPLRHEVKRERRQRTAVLETVGALATRQMLLYRRLVGVMENERELEGWKWTEDDRDWLIHKQALADFPVGALIGFDISLLITLRAGADYGLRCCSSVMKWNPGEMRNLDGPDDPRVIARWHMQQAATIVQVALKGE